MCNIPGCRGSMSLVWKELKATKANKLNLSAVSLDIADAYGSV